MIFTRWSLDEIKNSQNKYNDITYFIIFILELVEEELEKIEREILRENIVKFIIAKIKKDNIHIPQRALKYLKILKRRKNKDFDIKDYTKTIKVSRETARRELLELTDKNIVKKEKRGRRYNYILNYDLFK